MPACVCRTLAYSLLLTVLLFIPGTLGNNHETSQHYASVALQIAFWQTIGGYAVIGVIILVTCGGISLVSWLVCMCHEKATKKRRVNQMAFTSGTGLPQPPVWATRLAILPHLANVGFGNMSDGMQSVDTYHVIRHRKGDAINDGARWAVPLTKGKHLFEIIWAWGQRGQHSAVGLGTGKASLKANTTKSLVGKDGESWGLDIVSRRLYHKGKIVSGQYPPDGSFVPDRFLMYVDLDNGQIGYGTDVTFWGFMVHGLPTDGSRPLYVMASTNKWQAGIRIYYKGSEDPNNFIMDGPSTLMSSYAMPPPPGPAYTGMPSSAPPAYIEVEPSTSNGKRKGEFPKPPDPALPLTPPKSGNYSPPPPYID